jgi:hypothetical protein
MKVRFRSIDPDGARWRAYAARRLGNVLRWLRLHVGQVHLRLEDINGPGAGVDKRCELRAELADGQVARIAATSRHWKEAVELATARLRERVLGQLQSPVGTGRPAAAQRRHRAPVRLPVRRPAR